MGVVSGVVMSYQFGANWSEFTVRTAPVIGPLLAYEVLTAFFLEASFLGVMLFGWKKVGPRLHFTATCMVAVGTWSRPLDYLGQQLDAASSRSRAAPNGRFVTVDWWQVVFSPSFPLRLIHMVLAAYLTTALVVGAASAGSCYAAPSRARAASPFAWPRMFAVVASLQLVVGDLSGKQVKDLQPSKLAAIEAFWETRLNSPSTSWPGPIAKPSGTTRTVDPQDRQLDHRWGNDRRDRGAQGFAREDQPPVAIVFWRSGSWSGLAWP